MLYEEFLLKSGATKEEVPLAYYERYVEKAYMERDDLFPDQDSVINWYKSAGLAGFSKNALQKLDALRKAIGDIKRSFPPFSEAMITFAEKTAPMSVHR